MMGRAGLGADPSQLLPALPGAPAERLRGWEQPLALDTPDDVSAALCTALNQCTATCTATSFIPHCQPCLGLAFCSLLPVLSQHPAQTPVLLSVLSLLIAVLTVAAWMAQKEQ